MTDIRTEQRTAVFLDRDGTIIEDRGFLTDPSEVVFVPGAFTALRRLQEHFQLFIVTHQAGISRGLQTTAQVDGVNNHIVAVLAQQGIRIVDVYCCPHDRSEDCSCIKPKPYFLDRAAADHGVDLAGSFSMGDHPADVELATNAGGVGLYVLTGHGRKHLPEIPDDTPVFSDISAATDWILRQLLTSARTQRA